jgi:hypothetical protein
MPLRNAEVVQLHNCENMFCITHMQRIPSAFRGPFFRDYAMQVTNLIQEHSDSFENPRLIWNDLVYSVKLEFKDEEDLKS